MRFKTRQKQWQRKALDAMVSFLRETYAMVDENLQKQFSTALSTRDR